MSQMKSTSVGTPAPNEQQRAAIHAIAAWYKARKSKMFYLAGYAGTGKTTTVAHVLEALNLEKWLMACYTGKAASVLSKKMGMQAYTCHQLLYTPSTAYADELKSVLEDLVNLPTKDEETKQKIIDLKKQIGDLKKDVRFVLKDESAIKESQLLIIDECSMISHEMGNDILAQGCPTLVLGDPAQLPPVKGAGFFTDREPDFFLDKIERQAEGHPIIQVASMARQGQKIPISRVGESFIKLPRGSLGWEEFAEAEQVLTGTNATRRKLNTGLRKKRGFSGLWPQEGERIICCANNHNQGLLNGVMYTAMSNAREVDLDQETFVMDVMSETGQVIPELSISTHRFQQYVEPDTYVYPRRDVEEFDFGHAITVHKAQGSEWESVVLCDDWGTREYWKWLYTGITRAREKLTIVGG